MGFTETMLNTRRAAAWNGLSLPKREPNFPSPADWRDEVLYFLLQYRLSDAQEQTRPLLRSNAWRRATIPST